MCVCREIELTKKNHNHYTKTNTMQWNSSTSHPVYQYKNAQQITIDRIYTYTYTYTVLAYLLYEKSLYTKFLLQPSAHRSSVRCFTIHVFPFVFMTPIDFNSNKHFNSLAMNTCN